MNNVNYETTYLYYISNSTCCNYGNIELHILITFRIYKYSIYSIINNNSSLKFFVEITFLTITLECQINVLLLVCRSNYDGEPNGLQITTEQ